MMVTQSVCHFSPHCFMALDFSICFSFTRLVSQRAEVLKVSTAGVALQINNNSRDQDSYGLLSLLYPHILLAIFFNLNRAENTTFSIYLYIKIISLTKHELKYILILNMDGQHFISSGADKAVNLCLLIPHNAHFGYYSQVPKLSFLLQSVLIHSSLGTLCLKLGKPKGAHWLPSWLLPSRMGKGQNSHFSANSIIMVSFSPPSLLSLFTQLLGI